MTFALIALTALAVTLAFRKWQEVEMTAARWELYRLRDAVRSDLVEKKAFSQSTDLHDELDESLTALCAACQVRAISLYMFGLGALVGVRQDRWQDAQMFQQRLKRPENSTLRAIYEASTIQVLRVLLWRHGVLVVALAPTIVGLGVIGAAMYVAATKMLALAPLPSSRRLLDRTALPTA